MLKVRLWLPTYDTVLTLTAILRDVPGVRIPGGSEDVLLDLSVRQLVKVYQAQEKKLGQASKI